MNIDVQQNDDRVQQSQIRALDDDELCLVQGGAGPLDFAKSLFETFIHALQIGNGRPQA
jgi:hypothetical protein